MNDISRIIEESFTGMVFGDQPPNKVDNVLAYFTNPELRSKLPDPNIVWKDGNSRFPHINRFTGTTGMYLNPEVLTLGTSDEVIGTMNATYGVDNLVMTHGPPTLIVKPPGAGRSAAHIYRFQDIAPGDKFIAIHCVEGSTGKNSGEFEVLQNANVYYELLSLYFNYSRHFKVEDVVYLEKWFSIPEANEVIEEYTALYNWSVRSMPFTLNKEIRWEVNEILQNHKIEVPVNMRKLIWESVDISVGEIKVFSSLDVVRTAANNTNTSRIYIQTMLEPEPENWQGSKKQQNLRLAYKTGKFGNWHKPGLRRYLRENSTEYNWHRENGTLKHFLERVENQEVKKILGI